MNSETLVIRDYLRDVIKRTNRILFEYYMEKTQGFTLIELVIVIVIFGILSAVALPKFVIVNSSTRIASLNELAGKFFRLPLSLKHTMLEMVIQPFRLFHLTTDG